MTAISHAKVINSNVRVTLNGVLKLHGNGSTCTASVVGFNPPTVITARHCVEMGVVEYNWIRPETIIEDNFYNMYFSTARVELPGDIAIIIYPAESAKKFRQGLTEKDLFSVGSFSAESWKLINFCGYGSSAETLGQLSGIGEQRCGDNYIQLPGQGPTISAGDQVTQIHSLMQYHLSLYGNNTRIGIAALTHPSPDHPYGQFDKYKINALIQQGDSGGPFFLKDKSGTKILVGVTSAVIPSTDNKIIGALAWRMDHEWTRGLLKRAHTAGADIKGFKP